MVLEITSLSQFEQEIAGPGLVVVDFFTTWCGPCKKIAPFIDQLQSKYPEVKFIKVDIEKNEDIAGPKQIQSIPTFHFYVKGSLKDEMKGADSNTLEQKVIALKVDNVNPFGGQGFKLAVTETGVPTLSAREARLKAFGNVEGPHKQPTPKPVEPTLKLSSEDVDEDMALAKALAMSAAEATAPVPTITSKPTVASKIGEDAAYAAAEAEQDALDQQAAVKAHAAMNDDWDGEEMVPVPVDESLLAQLLDMGFPDVRGRKSLVHGITLDGALAWLGDHQDDADIDQPYMVKKSDTIPKVPLTEEEKLVRMAAIKDRVKQRREEKAKEARADEIKREKERRERGSKIDETLEERQRMARKREAEKMKKEKDVSRLMSLCMHIMLIYFDICRTPTTSAIACARRSPATRSCAALTRAFCRRCWAWTATRPPSSSTACPPMPPSTPRTAAPMTQPSRSRRPPPQPQWRRRPLCRHLPQAAAPPRRPHPPPLRTTRTPPRKWTAPSA